MKHLLLAVSIISCSNLVFANQFQLGMILGAPTGISGKVVLENNRAIDGAVAYSLEGDKALQFHTDYLMDKAKTFTIEGSAPIHFYYGVGLRLIEIKRGKHDGDVALGVRTPAGLTMDFVNPNIEVFSEIALCLDLVPATDADLEAAVGVRYKF